jgi:hypothetical protein
MRSTALRRDTSCRTKSRREHSARWHGERSVGAWPSGNPFESLTRELGAAITSKPGAEPSSTFVVQLEVLVERRWLPVIRYDMAHGIPHVDRYETPTRRSKTLLDMTADQALTHAQLDVRRGWKRYRDCHLGRRAR